MARLQPYRSSDSSNRSGFREEFGSDLTLSADGGLLAHTRSSVSTNFGSGPDTLSAGILVQGAEGAGFGVPCAAPTGRCTYRYFSGNDFRIDQSPEIVHSLSDFIQDFDDSLSEVVGPAESDTLMRPPAYAGPTLSADGTTLAFQRGEQIVVVDLTAGGGATPWIASTGGRAPQALAFGGGGDGPSSSPSLSGAGDLVAFASSAPDLLSAATPARPGKGRKKKSSGDQVEGTQILLKDLDTGMLTLVSADRRGRAGDGPSGQPVLSGDGRLVVFESDAGNLESRDGNGVRDVFVKDLKTGRISLISADRRRDPGNGPSEDPALSLDGRFVAFTSAADDLAPGDLNDAPDVFVKNVRHGRIEAASADPAGNLLGGTGASISGDGRYVVFLSDAGGFLTGDVTANAFVKDMATGALARLDVGALSPIDSTFLRIGLASVEISADGSTIGFAEAFQSISIDPGATPEEAQAAVQELEALFAADPLFLARDVVGITANPLFEQEGADASHGLEDPAFDLAALVPGATGLARTTTQALTLEDGGPAGLHLPADQPLTF